MARRLMRSMLDDELEDLDSTIDHAVEDLGDISLAGRALDAATAAAPPSAQHDAQAQQRERDRQLAQFQRDRQERGYAPFPQNQGAQR